MSTSTSEPRDGEVFDAGCRVLEVGCGTGKLTDRRGGTLRTSELVLVTAQRP